MGDFLFDQMKSLYPEATDEEVIQKIQATDAPAQLPVEAPVPVANPYKDMAIENVRQKYLGDKYGDAARQKIIDKNKEDDSGPNFRAALGALGAGFSGRDPSAAANDILKQDEAKRASNLSDFDSSKNAQLTDLKTGEDLTKFGEDQDKLKREMDPNSVESKLAQDLFIQMGGKPEQAAGLTAAKFKDFSPVMEKKYAVAEATQARKDIAQSNNETRLSVAHENALNRADSKVARDETKASDNEQKDALKLQNDLDKGWATRGGQGGVIQGKITAAQAAEALIEQGKKQPGGLDSRQTEELAQSAARLLGGGNSASARVEALVPHTFWGKAQSLKEWLSNKPQGQDMQAFTDRLAETVKREKDLAQDQMREYQIQTLPAHTRLQKTNPELFNKILQAKGIEPEMIDEKGRYNKRPSKSPTEMEADNSNRPSWAK